MIFVLEREGAASNTPTTLREGDCRRRQSPARRARDEGAIQKEWTHRERAGQRWQCAGGGACYESRRRVVPPAQDCPALPAATPAPGGHRGRKWECGAWADSSMCAHWRTSFSNRSYG